MNEIISNILEVVGLLAISFGIGMIYIPAGVIALGAFLAFVGYTLTAAVPLPTEKDDG